MLGFSIGGLHLAFIEPNLAEAQIHFFDRGYPDPAHLPNSLALLGATIVATTEPLPAVLA